MVLKYILEDIYSNIQTFNVDLYIMSYKIDICDAWVDMAIHAEHLNRRLRDEEFRNRKVNLTKLERNRFR